MSDSQKTAVIFGLANKRSIAWAIAKAWAAAGARLVFNYQGERLKENVEELTAELLKKGEPVFEAVAADGTGVFDTLKAVAKQVLTELRKS